MVLGKRADLSSLLDPNKKCVVEASFQIEEYALKTLFESLDVDYEDYTVYAVRFYLRGNQEHLSMIPQ